MISPSDLISNNWNPNDRKLVRDACGFAMVAHAGAVRKGTSVPYISHPLEAAAIVKTIADEPVFIAAAVLHDVVEDTPHTIEEIKAQFGSTVANIVAHESENKREDRPAADTWRLRKQETLDGLEKAPESVKIVAMGDKLSNMRAIAKDYAEIGDKLWERFNQKDKNEQGWYYRGVAEKMVSLKDTDAYKEYVKLVEKVFVEKENKK